jgi:sulfonate transport system substrate-binding protein
MPTKARILLLLTLLILGLVSASSAQDDEPLHIRIGVQRGTLFNVPELYDNLVAALNEGLGREVTVELLLFTSGPPLLEALNAGSIDIGGTGDTPPIFAQAAGVPLVYVASSLSNGGSALLVPENSPVTSVDELKGKKVAFAPGSSAHLFTVRAVEQAGLAYGDIEPVLLQPGDARAAFDGGSIDAWAVWDPFVTIAVNTVSARPILTSADLPPVRGYQLAAQKFVEEQPQALHIVLQQTQAATEWSIEQAEDYAAFLEETSGVPAEVWLAIRETYGINPQEYLNEAIIAEQQAIADEFYELGLIPEQIDVSEAVWVPETIDLTVGGIIGEEENE